MTIKRIQMAPQGLRLLLRVSLAILAMILAEHAAEIYCLEADDNAVDAEETDTSGSGYSPMQPRYTSSQEDEEGANGSQERVREGTILTDLIGQFKVAGDLATFTVKETGQRFGGLENLNLARITNIIRDDPTADWCVSGMVTEFRGSNYILIQKAIRKTNTDSSKSLKRNVTHSISEPEEEDELQ